VNHLWYFHPTPQMRIPERAVHVATDQQPSLQRCGNHQVDSTWSIGHAHCARIQRLWPDPCEGRSNPSVDELPQPALQHGELLTHLPLHVPLLDHSAISASTRRFLQTIAAWAMPHWERWGALYAHKPLNHWSWTCCRHGCLSLWSAWPPNTVAAGNAASTVTAIASLAEPLGETPLPAHLPGPQMQPVRAAALQLLPVAPGPRVVHVRCGQLPSTKQGVPRIPACHWKVAFASPLAAASLTRNSGSMWLLEGPAMCHFSMPPCCCSDAQPPEQHLNLDGFAAAAVDSRIASSAL